MPVYRVTNGRKTYATRGSFTVTAVGPRQLRYCRTSTAKDRGRETTSVRARQEQYRRPRLVIGVAIYCPPQTYFSHFSPAVADPSRFAGYIRRGRRTKQRVYLPQSVLPNGVYIPAVRRNVLVFKYVISNNTFKFTRIRWCSEKNVVNRNANNILTEDQ